MNGLIYLAVLLLIAWIVIRLVLAVTGAFLHLIWIAALVLFAFWLWGKITGKSGV